MDGAYFPGKPAVSLYTVLVLIAVLLAAVTLTLLFGITGYALLFFALGFLAYMRYAQIRLPRGISKDSITDMLFFGIVVSLMLDIVQGPAHHSINGSTTYRESAAVPKSTSTTLGTGPAATGGIFPPVATAQPSIATPAIAPITGDAQTEAVIEPLPRTGDRGGWTGGPLLLAAYNVYPRSASPAESVSGSSLCESYSGVAPQAQAVLPGIDANGITVDTPLSPKTPTASLRTGDVKAYPRGSGGISTHERKAAGLEMPILEPTEDEIPNPSAQPGNDDRTSTKDGKGQGKGSSGNKGDTEVKKDGRKNNTLSKPDSGTASPRKSNAGVNKQVEKESQNDDGKDTKSPDKNASGNGSRR